MCVRWCVVTILLKADLKKNHERAAKLAAEKEEQKKQRSAREAELKSMGGGKRAREEGERVQATVKLSRPFSLVICSHSAGVELGEGEL